MAETIQTKQCSRCKDFKPLNEFHKNCTRKDGLQSYCKTCGKIHHRKYEKTEKGKMANLKASLRYSRTTKGKVTAKRYQQSEKGKIVFRKGITHYQIKHPEQRKARNAIRSAIRAGKMPQPDTLQCHYYLQNPDCEKQAKQYHHWHGYEPEHWLDVVPACITCHFKAP